MAHSEFQEWGRHAEKGRAPESRGDGENDRVDISQLRRAHIHRTLKIGGQQELERGRFIIQGDPRPVLKPVAQGTTETGSEQWHKSAKSTARTAEDNARPGCDDANTERRRTGRFFPIHAKPRQNSLTGWGVFPQLGEDAGGMSGSAWSLLSVPCPVITRRGLAEEDGGRIGQFPHCAGQRPGWVKPGVHERSQATAGPRAVADSRSTEIHHCVGTVEDGGVQILGVGIPKGFPRRSGRPANQPDDVVPVGGKPRREC